MQSYGINLYTGVTITPVVRPSVDASSWRLTHVWLSCQFSALAAVREAEELEEQIRNSHSHDKHSGSTPGHQHQRPCPTQTPTSHQGASPAPALIPGTHPSWNEAQCLLPPSSPSPPPADVSPYSSFWPFSAISQVMSAPTFSISTTSSGRPRFLRPESVEKRKHIHQLQD